MVAISPQETCQEVLQNLRSSNLIFLVQESPYSACVTIRKRYRKEVSHHAAQSLSNRNSVPSSEVNQSNRIVDNLTVSNNELKAKYDEALVECEELQKKVIEFETIVEILHSKLEKSEKKPLENNEIKIKKFVTENKNLKVEKEELAKEVTNLNLRLKTSKKDLQEACHRHEKKTEDLEFKIKNLMEFKLGKDSEEKGIKNKQKKIDKKMKLIEEREAKLEVEKNKFERTKWSQLNVTDANKNFKVDEANNISIEQTPLNQSATKTSEPPPDSTTNACSTISTYSYSADLTTYPSMVTHWRAPNSHSKVLLPVTTEEFIEIVERDRKETRESLKKILEALDPDRFFA